MNKQDAQVLAARFRIPLDSDFHALDRDTVLRVIEAADSVKYRAPRTANGSRARYFYHRMVRAGGTA